MKHLVRTVAILGHVRAAPGAKLYKTDHSPSFGKGRGGAY